jgi:hypothetical protein
LRLGWLIVPRLHKVLEHFGRIDAGIIECRFIAAHDRKAIIVFARIMRAKQRGTSLFSRDHNCIIAPGPKLAAAVVFRS